MNYFNDQDGWLQLHVPKGYRKYVADTENTFWLVPGNNSQTSWKKPAGIMYIIDQIYHLNTKKQKEIEKASWISRSEFNNYI